MRFIRHSLTGLLLIAVTLGLVVYAAALVRDAVETRLADEPRMPQARERVFAVNVVQAREETITPILTAFGEVRSRRTLEIRAATTGTVIELAETFEEGATVSAGQVLARIDPANAQSELDRASNDLRDAEIAVRDADRALEIARDTLERRGIRTRGMSKLELAGRALHSTSDFPFITADVMGKVLRDQYDSTPRTFTAWARQTTAPDFKTIRRIQLGDAPSLTKVNEAGEFAYGTLTEGQETYVLSTYGKILPMTRQLLINDDMSAFTRVPQLMARAAADLESDIVYGILSDNADLSDGDPLFDAAHSNEGTDGAISVTTLDEARIAMREQTNLAGRPINVMPRYLVVGPKQETAAAQFTNTDYVPETPGNINPFARMFQVVVDPRITDYTWYVMADPGQIDTVEYAYLEGQQGVYMDTEMGFDTDGVKFKVRHDFGAGAIDHRGVFRNVYTGP